MGAAEAIGLLYSNIADHSTIAIPKSPLHGSQPEHINHSRTDLWSHGDHLGVQAPEEEHHEQSLGYKRSRRRTTSREACKGKRRK
jgi:hypothetical protein